MTRRAATAKRRNNVKRVFNALLSANGRVQRVKTGPCTLPLSMEDSQGPSAFDAGVGDAIDQSPDASWAVLHLGVEGHVEVEL
jgi:hypothetical protein